MTTRYIELHVSHWSRRRFMKAERRKVIQYLSVDQNQSTFLYQRAKASLHDEGFDAETVSVWLDAIVA